MLRRIGLPLAICLLMFAHVVAAQTETPTAEAFPTFPVEQRCINTPTTPPQGWTYPGMILMSGYAGIHAMEADWSTPHVVAQFAVDQQGNYPIAGGQLSPDGRWYATPVGELYTEPSFNEFWIVHDLRVYDLSGNNKTVTLGLTNYQNSLSGQSAWGFSPVEWQDNTSLILGGLLIRPFENAIETSSLDLIDSFDLYNQRAISPDRTRAYGGLTAFLEDFQPGLHDLVNLKTIVDLGVLGNVSWRRDSSGFIGEMQQKDQSWHGLAYFDRDGKLIAHVLQFEADPYADDYRISGRTELQWSPDNRYFPFVIDAVFSPKKLYIVDMQAKTVIDTCLTSLTQPVWSPDGTMFTYLTAAPQNLYLIVVDTKTWKSYIVARQSGARGSLGAPEMIGWRSVSASQ